MLNNKEKKNIILINDIRAVPLISAVKLKINIKNSILVAHQSIFENREYADYTNNVWKGGIRFFLKLFFNLNLIKYKSRSLDETEKMGYYSSLYSITEDSNATELKYPTISKQVYNLTLGSKDVVNYIKKAEPHNVFLFNGRTASSYLVTKFCVQNNVNLFFYEFAGHLNGFRLFPIPPHAAGKMGAYYLNYYKRGIYRYSDIYLASEQLKFEKLNSIYKKLNNQKVSKTYDIVIFLGSDFEYTAVDPEICDISWLGNLNFCKSVFDKYGLEREYTIRCHPNSSKDPNWEYLYSELFEGINNIGLKNFEIIPPNSKTDSHDLISKSNLVVTDLSTISLDSILLNKKTDIFGNTDIRYIYLNDWFNSMDESEISDKIMLPYSLGHNIFVFRFSYFEKFLGNFLFLVHRLFDKFNSKK